MFPSRRCGLITWKTKKLDCFLAAMCRTYHTLISPGKGKTRLQQVIDWVGGPDFDGVIVFDEAHKVNMVFTRIVQQQQVQRSTHSTHKSSPP